MLLNNLQKCYNLKSLKGGSFMVHIKTLNKTKLTDNMNA